jgi:hypothetical protein
MNFKIYYRQSLMDKSELTAASNHFDCVDLLSNIKANDFVIPRYSLYPFPRDQEKEIINIGAKLINSYNQHLYIADLQNYISDLKDLTPKTWDRLQDLPDDKSFVLKGETNSKKSNWNKNMFASNKREAGEVYSKLCDDTLIGQQKIYIREYIPLVTYFTGIGGVPITKEFRFFIAYGQVLSGAYYWQNYAEEFDSLPSVDEVPKEFLQSVIDKVGNNSNFYVVDVAQTTDDKWIVIELNDGCQSGLSCNDPGILYKNLKNLLIKRY